MGLLLILFLITLFSTVGGDFTLYTSEGEGIAFARCQLRAPIGKKFSSTTPELRLGNEGRRFEFAKVRGEFGDRFHGDHFPDVANSKILIGTITIRGYNDTDLAPELFCFQYLNDDKIIQYPLTKETNHSTTCTTDSTGRTVASNCLTGLEYFISTLPQLIVLTIIILSFIIFQKEIRTLSLLAKNKISRTIFWCTTNNNNISPTNSITLLSESETICPNVSPASAHTINIEVEDLPDRKNAPYQVPKDEKASPDSCVIPIDTEEESTEHRITRVGAPGKDKPE
ncbi:hypothetical protein LOD99_16073 [Oopsacas minuta]|uniref:Uncharacterized protein n=1 Tax=Oopsacas minuta TaxID=111878 RepID=A0AAV7K7U9_9METZ|nr:hypothetical protein LOD99_16073 [Oopsacas minuta]